MAQRAQNLRMPSVIRDALFGAFLLGALVAAGAARADGVTIYRCVDASGGITLQDRPCPKDAHQEVRQMLRPQDAPPTPEPIAVAQPQQRTIRVRAVRDPEPLYQCTGPNGDTYVSQSGIPQGHYAPLWVSGYGNNGGSIDAVDRARAQQANGAGQFQNGAGQFRGGIPGQYGGIPYGAVAYVQDSCVRMPQDEVCDSLRDRDSALGNLIFNAQPDERERYQREQKALRTQMRNDCDAND